MDNKYIKYKRKGSEEVSIKQYLEAIRTYLGDITDDLKTSGECKTELTMKI